MNSNLGERQQIRHVLHAHPGIEALGHQAPARGFAAFDGRSRQVDLGASHNHQRDARCIIPRDHARVRVAVRGHHIVRDVLRRHFLVRIDYRLEQGFSAPQPSVAFDRLGRGANLEQLRHIRPFSSKEIAIGSRTSGSCAASSSLKPSSVVQVAIALAGSTRG